MPLFSRFELNLEIKAYFFSTTSNSTTKDIFRATSSCFFESFLFLFFAKNLITFPIIIIDIIFNNSFWLIRIFLNLTQLALSIKISIFFWIHGSLFPFQVFWRIDVRITIIISWHLWYILSRWTKTKSLPFDRFCLENELKKTLINLLSY